MDFVAVKNPREICSFVIYSYFKESAWQLKRMQNCKLGLWVPFVNERYKKGVLFLLKKSIDKGKGLDLGAEPPLIIIIIGIVTVANSFFFATAVMAQQIVLVPVTNEFSTYQTPVSVSFMFILLWFRSGVNNSSHFRDDDIWLQ